jgi:hypothetical protein
MSLMQFLTNHLRSPARKTVKLVSSVRHKVSNPLAQKITALKKAEGRGQKAEGLHQLGIQTPPEQEPPNFQFGRGLKPLLPRSRSTRAGIRIL